MGRDSRVILIQPRKIGGGFSPEGVPQGDLQESQRNIIFILDSGLMVILGGYFAKKWSVKMIFIWSLIP